MNPLLPPVCPAMSSIGSIALSVNQSPRRNSEFKPARLGCLDQEAPLLRRAVNAWLRLMVPVPL